MGLVDRDELSPPLRFTRSGNERAFLRLLEADGLPLPLTNQAFPPYEADFYWPEFGLIVEIGAWHTRGNRRSFERDRLKDEHLMALGLRVLRITDTRLHNHPEEVARAVRRAMRIARPA